MQITYTDADRLECEHTINAWTLVMSYDKDLGGIFNRSTFKGKFAYMPEKVFDAFPVEEMIKLLEEEYAKGN